MDHHLPPRKRRSFRPPPQLRLDLLNNEDTIPQPPPVAYPARYVSSYDYRLTCALVGCNVRNEVDSFYCCEGHRRLAINFSNQTIAFHLFNGFQDPKNDRALICSIILLNRLRNLQVGVPFLGDEVSVFDRLPWTLDDIIRTHANWLFFKTPPATYTQMNDQRVRWKSNRRFEIEISGIDHPPIFYFKLGLENGPKQWKLHHFQCEHHSLYCLSCNGDEPASPEPTVQYTPSNKNNKDDDDDVRKHPSESAANASSLPLQLLKPSSSSVSRSRASSREKSAYPISHHGHVADSGVPSTVGSEGGDLYF